MVFGTGGRTHYDTLGVKKDASIEDIKAAFRKLSKETHPDLNPNANADDFKRISEAANILTNERQRQKYDAKLESNMSFRSGPINHNYSRTSRQPKTPMQQFWYTFFRPRNLAIGVIGVYSAVYAINLITEDSKPKKDMVQAWKNPKTGLWEQPAPWDPLYKQVNPTLHFVPRDQVKSRHR